MALQSKSPTHILTKLWTLTTTIFRKTSILTNWHILPRQMVLVQWFTPHVLSLNGQMLHSTSNALTKTTSSSTKCGFMIFVLCARSMPSSTVWTTLKILVWMLSSLCLSASSRATSHGVTILPTISLSTKRMAQSTRSNNWLTNATNVVLQSLWIWYSTTPQVGHHKTRCCHLLKTHIST